MEGSRDWAGLMVDILECISGRLVDPQDFVRFRAVCPQWRESIPSTAHPRFHPWILKTDDVYVSGNIVFYSLSSDKLHQVHVPALKGRRTRLAGIGAGRLIAIDRDDDLSAVLLNPLTGDTTALPRLPEWCRGVLTYGFATADPKMTTGEEEDVFVVIYPWWFVAHGRINVVAMWRCGSDNADWATVPSKRFWTMMPRHRRRLAENGPRVLEADELEAAAAGGNGDGGLVNDGTNAHLIEHEGHVRLLFRQEEDHWSPLLPSPRVTFALHDMVGDKWALVDWDKAPDLHDKVILQSVNSTCYVLPASDVDFVGGMRKNCIKFLSWLRKAEGEEEDYYLCTWDLAERVTTIGEKIPGVWEWARGRWFLRACKNRILTQYIPLAKDMYIYRIHERERATD